MIPKRSSRRAAIWAYEGGELRRRRDELAAEEPLATST